ncbi:sensor histidine kinase [Chitinophaga sp. LS1]|uniref:sensor histidine kinase n=1 Tax=Chitinophaga sp. LS1 TaxID=3051176 RepID=UPI002AAC191D|nr:histidine kinase [Chitinophaga sp. LS1]WPV66889.1 histidine kinase [Chitinophaga sp. LS1]
MGIWILYAALQVVATGMPLSNMLPVFIVTSALFALLSVVFYGNAELLLPRTLEKSKKTLWIIGITCFFVYVMLTRYVLLYKLYPAAYHIPAPSFEFLTLVTASLWWWFQAIALSTAYWFFKVSINRERKINLQKEEINRKEREQLQLKQEKLELEVAYLRAQINPHFLFNTLGYFYNKTANSHPDVAEGIAALTNIMRSSLKKKGPDGMVSLEEEIEHIESLISIYYMRFNNNIHIEYSRPDNLHGQRILPHILITLVENAFKHGELHNAAYPLKIKLTLDDNGIYFCINNKKRIGPKEISNGIGMEYVQRQLDNTYPKKYSFDIKDTDLFYSLSLHIATTEITLHDQLLYN